MSEPGWQPFPLAGAPAEVAASGARGERSGFGVGAAAFASPTTGWVYAGGGESAQCRVLFTDDDGATWSPQLAWRGGFYPRPAVLGEREAGFGLSVSFVLTFWHRPLPAMISAFTTAGFRIAAIDEPLPAPDTPANCCPTSLRTSPREPASCASCSSSWRPNPMSPSSKRCS